MLLGKEFCRKHLKKAPGIIRIIIDSATLKGAIFGGEFFCFDGDEIAMKHTKPVSLKLPRAQWEA